MLNRSCCIVLDDESKTLRPIVRVIDDFAHNRSLANLFEARVGKGRLLLCFIDLLTLQDRPEARQLLRSLYDYVGSAAFEPKQDFDVRQLNAWFAMPPKSSGLDRASLRVEAGLSARANVAEPWATLEKR